MVSLFYLHILPGKFSSVSHNVFPPSIATIYWQILLWSTFFAFFFFTRQHGSCCYMLYVYDVVFFTLVESLQPKHNVNACKKAFHNKPKRYPILCLHTSHGKSSSISHDVFPPPIATIYSSYLVYLFTFLFFGILRDSMPLVVICDDKLLFLCQQRVCNQIILAMPARRHFIKKQK